MLNKLLHNGGAQRLWISITQGGSHPVIGRIASRLHAIFRLPRWQYRLTVGGGIALACLAALTAYAHQASGQGGSTNGSREITAAESTMLKRAEDILISRCMQRLGFAFFLSERKDVPDTRNFPYVIDDIAWAQKHGFGGQDLRRKAQAQQADPNQRYFRSLPEDRQQAALAALHGQSPEGLAVTLPDGSIIKASDQGCTAEAQQRLYGDLAAWFRAKVTVSNLTPMYVSKVEHDPRFTKAVEEWGRCMQRAGHQFTSPNQLREALHGLTEGLGPAEADAVEVRLAVAEATCARSTPLAATAAELDRQYGDMARQQYRSEIETKHRLQLAALDRARQITATGS